MEYKHVVPFALVVLVRHAGDVEAITGSPEDLRTRSPWSHQHMKKRTVECLQEDHLLTRFWKVHLAGLPVGHGLGLSEPPGGLWKPRPDDRYQNSDDCASPEPRNRPWNELPGPTQRNSRNQQTRRSEKKRSRCGWASPGSGGRSIWKQPEAGTAF